MSLKRSKKTDLPPLILSDMLFPKSIPLQSVGAIPVQAGLRRAIFGLAASLTSIDGVIFTGGVGENSAFIRDKVLSHLAILHP